MTTQHSTCYIITLLLSVLFFACSKDNETNPDGGGDGEEQNTALFPQDLTGTLYYDWATDGILQVDFPSGTGGTFIPDDTKLNGFDVSRDKQYRLTAVNASSLGNSDVRFTLSDLQNGSIIEEFVYNAPSRSSYVKGILSPDNNLIMVGSNDKEDGITILKVGGEFVGRLNGVEGEAFGFNETQLWLPDNEILFTHGKSIIRSAPPYTSGKLVKRMEYEDWGDLTVNHQGNQLALRIDKHIYTMDIDGNDLRQVTASNFKEAVPVFSPDSKYLLVGSDYKQTGPFGYMWYLKIIPHDGNLYNVDPIESNSAGVIPVILKGSDKIETAGGQVVWK